ncbi:MAG: ATP-binding cassette domain-containing protein [Anaerolineae bacterium]|nr:ATP-binding cassette domain-containing protein [Anaerolineae bacterium]NIN95000.1 ATP-binding cassette domain-containing protein [Anaerolineae bacterium]NIQ78041.1 ATP-binding cassette domain-containing protein [Anaerolineae bacterium]
MAKELLLDIKDLYVHFDVFGGSLKVLDGVYFVVYGGEKVGLVGETGCGKTTTMKAVLRVLPMPPARIPGGEIFFKGRDILKMSGRELSQVRGEGISMVFQDPTAALNPVFTIGQQLGAAVKYSGAGDARSSGKEIHQRAVSALKEVALPDAERLLKNYPFQLSGGMRQRVCIAMAVAGSRELIIADEPGTSLDVSIQDQILRLLRRLADERNTSIILITHTLGVVREMADRVYVMYAGNMVEVAPTDELFSQPLHPYTLGLMNAVPKLTGGGIAGGIPGRIPDYLDPPVGCRFHPRCDRAWDVCRQEKPRFYRVSEDHEVACFLYRQEEKGS